MHSLPLKEVVVLVAEGLPGFGSKRIKQADKLNQVQEFLVSKVSRTGLTTATLPSSRLSSLRRARDLPWRLDKALATGLD